MSIDTSFQSYVAGLTASAVAENQIPEDKAAPYVWWQRREGNVELLLSGATMLIETVYDVEVGGTDIDATASVADTLKTALHGFRGTMASSFVLGMFVQDHNDEYVPKSVDSDDGIHVFAFSVKVQS